MENLEIPDMGSEFIFQATRSSGPGGQNVNKVSSKVELYFDINASLKLTEWQKVRLFEKQFNKISKEGLLKIVCQADRSQLKNKETVVQKFYELLKKSFYIPKYRKATKPTKSAINERIKEKKVRAEIKGGRRKVQNLPE